MFHVKHDMKFSILTKEEQIQHIMAQSLSLQSDIAGALPYSSFVLLPIEERTQLVTEAVFHTPCFIVQKIVEHYETVA